MAKSSLRNNPVRGDGQAASVGGTTAPGTLPPTENLPALTPTQRLKNCMHPESWMLTQSFVQWGEVWENTKAGAITEYNEDSRMVMLSPFTFFNAAPQTIGVMFNRIVPYFLTQYGQYMTDKIFEELHPMPWLVLESFAPQFAMQDRGHDAMLEAWRCIREMRDTGAPALEPVEPQFRPDNPQPQSAQRGIPQLNRQGGDGRVGQAQHQSRPGTV